MATKQEFQTYLSAFVSALIKPECLSGAEEGVLMILGALSVFGIVYQIHCLVRDYRNTKQP